MTVKHKESEQASPSPYRKIKHFSRRLFSPLKDFLKDSRAVGIILIICTVLSLTLSNIPATQSGYFDFWLQHLPLSAGNLHLPQNPLAWINDGLMVVFFFLVGMEIKRELLIGELASAQKSMLPVLAALGGMIFPALIFFAFNGNTPFHHGWGIPMATDIAFSLGIISLLGNRIPVQLKIFLTALAIIDDLGAIVVIALFYASDIHLGYLLMGLGIFTIPILLNLMRAGQPLLYFIPGIVVWYCFLNSGIHPTIAGVLLAFCIPLSRISRLEHALYNMVNFIVMPLFALANTAIIFPAAFGHVVHSPVTFGVMLGLILGKPIGISAFSFLSVKFKIASLPSNTDWKQIVGAGMIAGIGFTMSIFIATLAYQEEELQVISKIAILAGSVIAGILGYCWLKFVKSKT